MFEWRVNQIRADLMERVLNHMEKQGYEVQVIVPLYGVASEQNPQSSGPGSPDDSPIKTQMLLAGKKQLNQKVAEKMTGMPAVTPENLDIIYGREKTVSSAKSA